MVTVTGCGMNRYSSASIVGYLHAKFDCEPVWPSGKALGW